MVRQQVKGPWLAVLGLAIVACGPMHVTASAAGPEPAAGMMADVSPATAEMGRVFLGYKVSAALGQIKTLSTQK